MSSRAYSMDKVMITTVKRAVRLAEVFLMNSVLFVFGILFGIFDLTDRDKEYELYRFLKDWWR